MLSSNQTFWPDFMKLFKNYNDEILHLMLMIMISFLVIMISISFVRYLAMAADGSIPLKNAIAILGVILPAFINLLLPISFFLAVVVGLNRLLHDNELLIGFACGMSYSTLIRKIYRLSLPIAFLGIIFSFFVVPKMNDYQDQLSAIASQNTSALTFLQSGRFFALGSDQIVYVGDIDLKTRNSQNIFVYQNSGEKTQIVIAPSGSINSEGNSLANVNLNNGQEYEISNTPGSLSVRLASFDHLLMTLIPEYDFSNGDLTAVSSYKLWKQHDLASMVELEWRFTLPLATLILTILGAALSDLRPRTTKIMKIFQAVTIFIIYFNLMTVVKSLVLSNRFPLFPGLFIVHIGFLIFSLVLLGVREGWFNFFYRLQKS